MAQAQDLSRAQVRSTVVSALLSSRAEPGVSPDLISDETSIGSAGLGISSLNLLQALVKIEDTLNVVFDDRAVAEASLSSVGAVVALVERLLAEAGG